MDYQFMSMCLRLLCNRCPCSNAKLDDDVMHVFALDFRLRLSELLSWVQGERRGITFRVRLRAFLLCIFFPIAYPIAVCERVSNRRRQALLDDDDMDMDMDMDIDMGMGTDMPPSEGLFMTSGQDSRRFHSAQNDHGRCCGCSCAAACLMCRRRLLRFMVTYSLGSLLYAMTTVPLILYLLRDDVWRDATREHPFRNEEPTSFECALPVIMGVLAALMYASYKAQKASVLGSRNFKEHRLSQMLDSQYVFVWQLRGGGDGVRGGGGGEDGVEGWGWEDAARGRAASVESPWSTSSPYVTTHRRNTMLRVLTAREVLEAEILPKSLSASRT